MLAPRRIERVQRIVGTAQVERKRRLVVNRDAIPDRRRFDAAPCRLARADPPLGPLADQPAMKFAQLARAFVQAPQPSQPFARIGVDFVGLEPEPISVDLVV